ncbi:MAG TPA: tetratricopeptide repeat protein [Gemmatimonadales bacterium]|nr:tetratricopeptide repeat protein [Gemmatimonadales bacterium]
MTAPALSERDLAVLRSFARRIDPSDAGAHNNLGVLYYQKGLVEDAIAEFTRALELDPKMQVAQRNLEIAYHDTGYYDRRVAQLRERLRQAHDDREARWELGRAYAILGAHEEAVGEFEQLLAQKADDGASIIQLGLAEKNRGRPEAATEWFLRAVELEPDSTVAHFYLGEIYYNRGLNAEALVALEHAVELNPDNANAHYLMAFVLGDMGRHQDARAASKRAIQLNPPLARAQTNLSLERYNAERRTEERRQRLVPEPQVVEGNELAHYNLGLAFRQKGYYNEALREYRLALERGEDRRLTLQAMAELHLLKHDFAAALELYDTLLREVPDSPKLWNERGVVLHQAGRSDEALASYRHAVEVDGKYAIAWNNLGVALARGGGADADAAIESFRTALRLQGTFSAARLNLALLLYQLRRFQLALEAYRQVFSSEPNSASAWNGVGLVLVELKRFQDARNAFVRAVEADADHAGAHYNLSFTLSNLGDFDGALRATKRALELDPYYVSQKFALTIDLQYEKATIGIAPEISADVTTESIGEDFNFDQRLLDNIFQELAPPAAAPEPPAARAADDPLALARDYVSKGLMDVAAAEAVRAVQRGANRADAAVLLGDIFAKRGLHGEALERYREARGLEPGRADARLGEVKALFALGGPRTEEARGLAEELHALTPEDVDALVAVAKGRAAGGDAAGALTALRQAQTRAPARADLHKLQGDVALRIGDKAGALDAYRAALELDAGYVQVWLDLGRLHEDKEEWADAQRAYERALDVLPTFHEAALALADLLRRSGRVKQAVVRLAELLEQDPYDLPALLLLGRALLDDKRDDQALEAFRRALKFDPEQVEALFQQGVALARLHRYGEAVQAWEKVTRIEPGGPFAQRARIHARTALDLQHIFAPD